jgi:hypothetical protein
VQSVRIVSAPSRAAPGDSVTVTAQAAPAVVCSIDAGPLSPGTGEALAARATDAAGRVSWTWTLGPVAGGVHRITVSCGGSSASAMVEILR